MAHHAKFSTCRVCDWTLADWTEIGASTSVDRGWRRLTRLNLERLASSSGLVQLQHYTYFDHHILSVQSIPRTNYWFPQLPPVQARSIEGSWQWLPRIHAYSKCRDLWVYFSTIQHMWMFSLRSVLRWASIRLVWSHIAMSIVNTIFSWFTMTSQRKFDSDYSTACGYQRVVHMVKRIPYETLDCTRSITCSRA